MEAREYPSQVLSALQALGIPPEIVSARALPLHPEARELVLVERGEDGREHLLAPGAAAAWKRMATAARSDGVQLHIASAFRSVERQVEIVRQKLASGLSVDAVLSVSAPPGFSEHHTGCAVDVGTPGHRSLDMEFADTEAFRWLSSHARDFWFALSYPEGNPHGYAYEPWHWRYHGADVTEFDRTAGMRSLENKIPPPIVAVVIAAAMWGMSGLQPTLPLAPLVRQAAVLGLAVLGVGFDLLGLIAFLRSKTTINPLQPGKASALVTAGVYRVSRNPMYLGLLLLLTAWAIHLSSVWSCLGPVFFVLYINRFQIAPEERVLRGLFGEEYARYAARVRRWL
jgi:zinc D-Ala-D-Ala carboxypeptidase